MARTRTAAAERAKQRQQTADQVSAELGRPVGVREAARHRQAQKSEPPSGSATGYLVRDRIVEFDPANCRRAGMVLGKVLDLKVSRGSYGTVTLQVAPEFWHTVVDAAAISNGHALLITLDELNPRMDNNDDR